METCWNNPKNAIYSRAPVRQLEAEPAMCPSGKEGQHHPGLQWEEYCQEAKEGD